jgi:hypothetical protein
VVGGPGAMPNADTLSGPGVLLLPTLPEFRSHLRRIRATAG